MKRIIVVLALLGGLVVIFFRHGYRHELAICAMFKNEAPWLKEWIDYHHRALGVSHFYLYNNDSTDDFLTVLQPYLDQGLVDIIDWPSTPEHGIWGVSDFTFIPYQLGAFNDCVKRRAMGQAKWLAVIDVDEFLMPSKGKKSLYALLDQASQNKIGSILLHWRIFGTSGVVDLEDGELLLERLTRRAPDEFYWNRHTKSIHRPEAIAFCEVHHAQRKKGYKKWVVKDPNEFSVHHYWARTQTFCCARRGALSAHEDLFNAIEDQTAWQYLSQIR
jgi:hypothetical protein